MGMTKKMMIQPGAGRHYEDRKQFARMLKEEQMLCCVKWHHVLDHCNLKQLCVFS
jgi:hypothetical protein